MTFATVLGAATPGDIVIDHAGGTLLAVTGGRSPLTLAGPVKGIADPRTEERYRLTSTTGPVTTAARPALHTIACTSVRAEEHGLVDAPNQLVRDLMADTMTPVKLGWAGFGWAEPSWRWVTPTAPTLVDDWDADTQITGLTYWRLEFEATDTTVHDL